MADTDIDDIKKQKKAQRNKRYYLKRKMEQQQQASTSSKTELPKSKRRKKRIGMHINLAYDIYMIRYFCHKIEIISYTKRFLTRCYKILKRVQSIN